MKRSKASLLRYAMECGINDREAYADADPERRDATLREVDEIRALMKELFGAGETTSDLMAKHVSRHQSLTIAQIKVKVREMDSAAPSE